MYTNVTCCLCPVSTPLDAKNMSKILIVEDNEDISSMLQRYLTIKDHDCVESNNGRNGLSLIQKGKFDFIFLDLSMPDFTGFDIIDSLEKDGTLKNQKIIVLTALNISNNQIDDLIKRGIYACLRKPVTLSELIKTIQA